MLWASTKLPKHLPYSLGPHTPGCLDVMSGYTTDSTFVRLYYPSASSNKENDSTKWFRWSPRNEYIEGLARLVNSWGTFIRALVWLYGGEPSVPAMWEAQPNGKKMPVLIYSHGFGATRFLSSIICSELASWGYCVASLEHKDTSACATYYYESEEKLKKGEESWIPHIKMEFGPNHYAIRNEQLHKRVDEVKKLLDYLNELNNGNSQNILQSSLNIGVFKGLLDLDSICIMGHSFGGATSLLTLALDNRIKCGVILDGWMFPLKEENFEINKPLLFINSQTFHIESNLQVIHKIIDKPADSEREVYTVKHTTHEFQTDMPHIIGYWTFWFMKKLSPEVGTRINNNLILAFLHKHIGVPEKAEDSTTYLESKCEDYVEGTFLYSTVPHRRFNKL